jgi:hypothetical protein
MNAAHFVKEGCRGLPARGLPVSITGRFRFHSARSESIASAVPNLCKSLILFGFFGKGRIF